MKYFFGMFGGILEYQPQLPTQPAQLPLPLSTRPVQPALERIAFSGHFVIDDQTRRVVTGQFIDGQGPFGSLTIKEGLMETNKLEVSLEGGSRFKGIRILLNREGGQSAQRGSYEVLEPTSIGHDPIPPSNGRITSGYFQLIGELKGPTCCGRYPDDVVPVNAPVGVPSNA
jgi:hypothetical protein